MTTKKQDPAKSRTAMLVWVVVILCTGLPWNTWGANPLPLGQIAVPEPPNLAQFVKDKAAAIRLGKAFFWDSQAGSDGVTACASCHYRAGADPLNVRSKNQLAPRASASGTSIFQARGANSSLAGTDFPFFQVSPVDAQIGTGTVTSDVHDVVGSQGVRLAKFEGVILGSPVDDSSPLVDAVFPNLRQVTGRNTPSAVNAVFNFANFWDGRANNIFNGSSPIGPLDISAGIWVDSGGATLVKQPVTIINASLASQAVGPPLSDVEMSFRGRTFPEFGRKMLSLTPLAQQTVHPADSVLGSISRGVVRPDGVKGLVTSYDQMIRDAFQENYWISAKSTTDGFTQMEANFSLFWGLAIQLYEATLVSDQTPLDKFLAGDPNHGMSAAAQNGFAIFSSQCSKCHSGSEMTSASASNAEAIIAATGSLVEPGPTGVPGSVSDIGFYNIGIRPSADDPGRGAGQPDFPFPLSFAGQAVANATNPGSIPFTTFPLPNGATAASPVASNGAFKMPGLRNVELTPPYWHNGGALTLEEVVEFYARGGNFANAELDVEMKPIGTLGNATQRDEVVAFLKALTDPRVKNETAPFDHPELLLPQGDPELPMTRLAAKGGDGQEEILPTLTMTVTSPTKLANQAIGGTLEKVGADVMAAPQIIVNGGAPAAATVSGSTWSYNVAGLHQGENTVTATATDLAGVSVTVTKTILAGITKPVGTIVIDDGAAATRTRYVTLTLNAAGPAAVSFMQFSLDDGLTFSPYEPFATTRNLNLSAGDGDKSVFVRFKDSAGSESLVYSDTIALDSTLPPALTINVITPTNLASQLITGTTEAGATLKVTVNTSASVGPVSISGTSWSAQVSGLKEGANTFTVTATDAKGNASTASAVITLDTMPPYLNIDTILGTRATATAIAGTAEVGSKIMVKCDKAKADVIFFDDLIQNITRWSGMLAGIEEGDNSCTVTATDAAGNATVKEAHIIRDTIPPDLDLHFDDLVKYGTVQTFYGTVESGITPVMTVNGGAYAGAMTVNGSAWSCSVSNLAEGNSIITVTATDSAGNKTTKLATITTVSASGSFSGGQLPSIADALKALRIAVGLYVPTKYELLIGDLFADDRIDVSDAILILKKVVGL